MIECQICLREFSGGDVGRTPRILTNCGHTLCEECANKLLMGSKITCPFDRKITALGGTGVKGLQKNFSLLESLEREVQTTNEATKTGIPCAENSSHDAIFYCEQCEVDLCEICFARLHKPKVFASHRRIFLSDKPLELPKCPVHSLNTAEFFCTAGQTRPNKQIYGFQDPYCKTPDKIMCHVCMTAGTHKFHKYDGLREMIEKKMYQLYGIFHNIKDYEDKCEKWMERYTNAIKSFDMTGAMFLEAEKVIIDTFDKRKKKALEDLRSLSKCKVASMRGVQNALKENLRVMKELREEVLRKAKMKVIVGNVDEVGKWNEVKDNVIENLKNEHELYDFGGVRIFLPVMNLHCSKTLVGTEALENSGLVCVHHVTDFFDFD